MIKLVKLILSFTIILMVICSTIAITEVNASNGINILSSSGWISSTGSYHISGELQNVGILPVNYVEVTATFYDSSNTVVGTDFTFSALNVIPVGEKSPFDILFIDKAQVPKIDHYTLTSSYSIAGELIQGLQILSNSSYTSSTGSLHIVGEIQNLADTTANYVQIIATCYDSEGTVVITDFTFTNPTDITSEAKAPFEILIIDKNRIPLISTYSLAAQSSQYALIDNSQLPSSPSPTTPTQTQSPTNMPTQTIEPSPTIPEFTSTITLALIIISTVAGAIFYKRSQIKT
jgi:hypothetical protein